MKLRLMYEDEEKILEAKDEFLYKGKTYPTWGNLGGKTKTIDYGVGKFNRYAKLGEIADELIAEFKRDVAKDPNSLNSRNAYASVLMLQYGVRIGNEDSAEGYESGLEDNKGEMVQTFGTTTLLNDHVSFGPREIKLDFLGKEQVEHNIAIDDPFIVQYGKYYYKHQFPSGKWLGIDYDALFDFVKRKAGKAFIPKDFRTFCANTTGWNAIQRYLSKPKQEKKSDANQEIKEVTEIVAARLGNTPGVAKSNYIDGRMLDWFKDQRIKKENEDDAK